MAHPKRKISKTRRDKRRTHLRQLPLKLVLVAPQVNPICTTVLTGMKGKLYYRGKVLIDNNEVIEA